jgi:hypothetical protein
MASEDLSADERTELQRLRSQVGSAHGGWTRGGRWLGACALLLVGAVLAGLATVAVYLRSEVLDTESYVQTVAPLVQSPPVREALAHRLTTEIVTRSDITGLANDLVTSLEAKGAPARIGDLVSPLVSSLTSFLYNKLYALLGTAKFEAVWQQVNRLAHTGLVTILTGGTGKVLASSGTTVTLDVGALLTAAKQQLVSDGLTFLSKIPDVSISYQLVDSKELPKLRRYTTALNAAGTWLPFVALVLLIAGVLVAPNGRRGTIIGFSLVAAVAAALLGVLALARAYYLDNLPATVESPDAAATVYDTILRFLVAALETLLVASLIFVVGGLLAGPSRAATAVRRLVNRGLDATARGLAHAGSWVGTVGRALVGGRKPIQVVLVLAALVGLILANRPSIAAVLWVTLGVLVILAVVELFIRSPGGISHHPDESVRVQDVEHGLADRVA